MKQTLLKTLHEKAVKTIEASEKAEDKKNYYVELLTRHQMTTYKNELKIWPMGQPRNGDWSEDNCHCQIQWYNEVLSRLDRIYLSLLDRITSNAIDNYKHLQQ